MKRKDLSKKRPLADTSLEGLEPELGMYRIHDGNGLYFRVKENGGKDWQLRYKKADGAWTFTGIGGYGKGAHQLTGAQARANAAELVKAAKAAGMPLESFIKQQASAGKPEHADTLRGLVEEWLHIKRDKWTPDNYKRTEGMLKKHVLDQLGGRPYRGITPKEWHTHFLAMQELGILETMDKVRGNIRSVYTLANVRDLMTFNPIHGISEFLTTNKSKRFPFVSFEEIPQLVRDLRQVDQRHISIGLQLLMMCACRPGELRQAKWEDFDLERGLWDLQAEDKKERREFTLPLSRQAVALLTELQTMRMAGIPWLFPGRDKPLDEPISDATFNQTLNRMGYKGRQSPHGFRHLFSTTANDLGKDPRIVDSALAHKIPGVEGIYNNASYITQRRELAQWWADEIDRLATNGAVAQAA